MTWAWIEQRPHANGPKDAKPLHILVGTDLTTGEQTYLAFVQEEMNDYGTPQFKAMVPNVRVQPREKMATQPYHYTHDSLQDAKDWCVAELVNRRLT